MDVNKLRADLNKLKNKEKGNFVTMINTDTKYTYRHVHNFLTIDDYNVTINFVQDMQNLIKEGK